jgi:hypothetical protein
MKPKSRIAKRLGAMIAGAVVLGALSGCEDQKGTNSSSTGTPKISSAILGAWVEESGASEVTFNADGSGIKKTRSNGTVTYTGGFRFVIPLEGRLRVTDNKTGAVDLLTYWLEVGDDILIVVDESPDTTVWLRAGDTLDPGRLAQPIPWNSSITYSSLTYAGQTYKTVSIGSQVWMAENLNVRVDSSWCYANSADSCAKYGRLYQWAAVMGLDASYNTRPWNGTLPHRNRSVIPSG